MINVRKVNKTYGDQRVLKDVDFSLPRYGLVVIYGPSGCGKTTLLNCLSALLPFEGDIEIDGNHIRDLSDKEKNTFRLKNIGFVFQDFKLFENDTVINNVLFPIEVLSNASTETKKRKSNELLKLVGLKNKEKQLVNKLSGGEKQRVAIARALINNPKVILADEPTGALDSKTATDIMTILEKVSTKSLVVIVSHDEELTKKYADQIIEMKDGVVDKISYQSKREHETYLPIEKTRFSEKKPAIPASFLFHHALSSMKQKKWRTMICNGVTSLGLIGVGLAITLSSSISTNIKKAYTSLIDDSKVMISLKDENQSLYGLYAGSFYEAMDLKNKYPEYIYDIGIDYFANFESYFQTINCIALADTDYYYPIDGISARHINEFKWLDVEPPSTMYPEHIDELEDDEVVLGLTINMINDICFGLRIERTVTSLSNYLKRNTLKMYFDLANSDWMYDDQQLFTVKGFSLEKSPAIYHYNHMWNEYMLEEQMRFHTSDSVSTVDRLPWVMKKVYYFQINGDNADFISMARKQKDFDPYLLEIANASYFPWLYAGSDTKDINRILFFANTLKNIPERFVNIFKEVSDELSNPIFGTYGGYSIFPSSLMMGFSNYMYFSYNEDSLTEVIDINTSLNTEVNQQSILPDDVLSGHYSQSMNGGVNFAILPDELYLGRKPNNVDEIVISTGMMKKLTGETGLNSPFLHLAYTISEQVTPDGQVHRDFKTIDVEVVGLVKSSKNYIYQESDWVITFFQSRLGVSSYYLGINTVAMEVKHEKNMDAVVAKLSRAFPDYSVVNPLADINESIDKVCGYIQIALACFSVIAILISVLLLTISNYLHILESRKEIGLARCIGIQKLEAKKFLYSHSLIMCLSSFALSSVELIVVSVIISYLLGNEFGSGFVFSFNPLSLVMMFILSAVISIFSSVIMANVVGRIAPLEALKS